MGKLEELAKLPVETRAALRRWLTKNHASATGVWVVTWKKETKKPRIDAAAIAEEALCFGWIDSLPRKLDAERTMLLITPRKPKSNWSKINKDRVAKLEREGLMTEAGRVVVAAAKKSGTWSALDQVENLEVPPDLEAELRRTGGSAFFAAFPRSAKRGILEWIGAAKTPATRARRITETATKAAKNERANQWRP
jgi:uncharacterized protein YdeI (YjbR/CyaY-like superfamily)